MYHMTLVETKRHKRERSQINMIRMIIDKWSKYQLLNINLLKMTWKKKKLHTK